MLVISRRKNEKIVINDDIEVVVVEIRGNKCRLGIQADKSIPVHRSEVKDAIERDRMEAAMKNDSPENLAYRKAKHRCQCENAQGYHRYGGRGIEFRFSSLMELIGDIGVRPSSEHSLDRKDNNGHYEIGNVRWATRVEQGNNMRTNRVIEYGGESKTIAQWAANTGIGVKTLALRLDAGWSVEDALTVAVEERNGLKKEDVIRIHEMASKGFSRKRIAEDFGVSLSTVAHVLTGLSWREVYEAIQRANQAAAKKNVETTVDTTITQPL